MDMLKTGSTDGSLDFTNNDGNVLTPVLPDSVAGSDSAGKANDPQFTRRSTSTHSLLAANNNTDARRGPHTEATIGTGATGFASLSMPPPLHGKPKNDRRLSASLASIKSPRRSEEGPRNYPTSPPASIRSFDERQQFLTSPQLSTTKTDTTNVTTSSLNVPGPPVLSPPLPSATVPNEPSILFAQSIRTSTVDETPETSTMTTQENTAAALTKQESTAAVGPAIFGQPNLDPPKDDRVLPARPLRQPLPRSVSNTRRLSRTTSVENSTDEVKPSVGTIGVCALDVKARSRPSRQILTRLQNDDEFEVIVFGDKVILDEEVENWPICDFLISFFSEGFPLDKAIKYVHLRKPYLVNDLQMQKVLWDRRLCLMVLDKMQVPSPRRLAITRDGGPRLESAELAKHFKKISGVTLTGAEDGTGGGVPRTRSIELINNGDTLLIDGQTIHKPFVEKPVSGEDHNIIIFFPNSYEGGGARKLFRKVGNKSSEYVKDLITPRGISEPDGSFIYEQFLVTDNSEDVKAYTVGLNYCHAETRKSPVVDGLVRRNTHGKELRYVTKLSESERRMASRIAKGFGQQICGFDLLRKGSESFVIDVNGWSFVKDNEDYYHDAANILRALFSEHKFSKSAPLTEESSSVDSLPEPQTKKPEAHPHRNALKTILRKSPSMKAIAAHLPPSRSHNSASASGSPKGPAGGVPLSSPPSFERGAMHDLPPAPRSVPKDMLPAPAIETEPPKDDSAIEQAPEKEEAAAPMPQSKHAWKLKGVVAVIRHADRTPKQKIKFTAHSPEFVDLLKGHHEEVLLKGEAALASVQAAVRKAREKKTEDQEKLKNLSNALNKKINQPDTKIQIKPMFKKRKAETKEKEATSRPIETSIPEHSAIESPGIATELTSMDMSPHANAATRTTTRSDSVSDNTFSRYAAKEEDLVIDKMQLVMKWGGEPTHSARYQSQDLGASMRDDWKLLNRDVLNDVRLFTSSEKRVKTSAQIWAAAYLGQTDVPEESIQVRKDLLDDSNAAKDVMDKVKKKLKHLLREGNSVPEQFAWPKDVPEPYIVMQNVVDLLKFHRRVMRHNFKKLQSGAAASLAALSVSSDSRDNNPSEAIDVNTIQARWCTGEDHELFRERWEKLFKEFCDTEKADPSKISELYDSMKYDALHNKQFLEWVFTPSQTILDEITREEGLLSHNVSPEPERVDGSSAPSNKRDSTASSMGGERHSLSQKLGLHRKSVLAKPPSTPPLLNYEEDAGYFKLFGGSGESKSKCDKRLGRLRELYRYAKILFDYIGPQEYGISDDEKLEIGLLTSLPLLREIVHDLEELQSSRDAASYIYFTKESHIYTLLNCIMEGGVHTKIKRATIPELDYLSHICFELYEARDIETDETKYSIRISISPGCHTIDPLDVSLDSKHAIGSAPRRTLTNHQEYRDVINTIRAKFDTVQLPKSFLAVNVSEKHEQEARRASEVAYKERQESMVEEMEKERVEEWQRHVEESQATEVGGIAKTFAERDLTGDRT